MIELTNGGVWLTYPAAFTIIVGILTGAAYFGYLFWVTVRRLRAYEALADHVGLNPEEGTFDIDRFQRFTTEMHRLYYRQSVANSQQKTKRPNRSD